MIRLGDARGLLSIALAVGLVAPPWPSTGRAETTLRARPADRRSVPSHLIRVQDGDTFYVGAETIRILGIDTPEIGQPRAAAAARRLVELLSRGPIVIVRRGQDVYGRTLADVFVGGRNVARILRAEGYAKPRIRRFATGC